MMSQVFTMTTRAVSFRTDEDTLARIDALAEAEDRSRNWWINKAIADALALEEAWEARLQSAIQQADAGETIPHDVVMAKIREKFDLNGD